MVDYTQGNTRIFVFSSERARQNLSELTNFYADGTFKSCLPPFDQLYTIHGDFGSTQNHTNMIPLVYALMSIWKTESKFQIEIRSSLAAMKAVTSLPVRCIEGVLLSL